MIPILQTKLIPHPRLTPPLQVLAEILGAKNAGPSAAAAAADEDSDEAELDPITAAATGVRLDKRSADANAYLRGLIWLMETYIMGQCPDYRFFYDGIAPSVNQLTQACLSSNSQHLSHNDFHPLPEGSEQPLLPFASAMALLPSKCQHLLPEAVRPLMSQSEGSILRDIYYECPTCKVRS